MLARPFRIIVFATIFISFFSASVLQAQTPTITITQGLQVGEPGKGVAWGNSTYVGVFSNKVVIRSTDGENWTRVQNVTMPNGSLQSLAFGAGLFVVVGSNGLIATSPDGITWTGRSSGTAVLLNEVKFLNGTFYVVGQNRTLLQSADGITWTSVSINTGTNTDVLVNIDYGNGVFAIGARNNFSIGLYIYYSATAAANSWTFTSIGAPGTLNRLQYIGDRFYIFTSGTSIYTSTNASSWTNSSPLMEVTLPNSTVQPFSSPHHAFNGIYDGTRWIFYGGTGYYPGSYGSVFVSTDGTAFTLQPQSAYIVGHGSAYANGKYFQWGNEGIVTSSDGVVYKHLGSNFNSLAKNNSGTYVGVGYLGSSGQIFSSTDFNTWTNQLTQRIPTLYSVIWDGSRFVAAGDKIIATSPDGVSWTTLSTPSTFFYSMIYDGTRYVAVGTNGGTGIIQTSTDGITWTTVNSVDYAYSRIRYVNGQYFAVGLHPITYEGIVMHSTDGTSWSDKTPSGYGSYLYNDVAWDGSKYVMIGSDWYYEFLSLTTTNPADAGSYTNKGNISVTGGVLPGSYFTENVLEYSNGKFVATAMDLNAGNAIFLLSTDGINWSTHATNAASEINCIVASGNQFAMLGSNDHKFLVNYGSTLPVQLKQFDAKLQAGDGLLTWSTASEQNSREFRIQHSVDAQAWEQLGVVAAAGNSEQLKSYQFKHRDLTAGTHYYRLLQVDNDNRQSYSAIRKLVVTEKSKLRVYPNPSNGDIQLQKESNGTSTVIVINANGQKLYQSVHTGNPITISSQSWPAGVYKIRVIENGRAEVLTFLKK